MLSSLFSRSNTLLRSATRAATFNQIMNTKIEWDEMAIVENGERKNAQLSDLLKGNVILITLPGAFTPTCSQNHVPSFMEHHDALKNLGIDRILCLAVNDSFVLKEWGDKLGSGDKV